MTVISLKDYAAQKNISYEAVRQQVVRYKDELEGHIIRDGRQQFLDEDAVAFLDAKRQKNPVAIIQQNKDEQIEELDNQVKQLLIKTAAQADRISELAQWKAENALAIAAAEQTKLLLTAAEQEKKDLEQTVAEIEAQNAVLSAEKAAAEDKARQEAEAAQKAQQELTDAHAAFEEDLRKKNGQIQAWEKYAADLEAYNSLGWFKRRKAVKPVPPIPPDMLEE